MIFILFFIETIAATDPEFIVYELNNKYTKLSGTQDPLYSLVFNFENVSNTEYVLLLNNSYTDLSLHTIKASGAENNTIIESHNVPALIEDPTSRSIITSALKGYLNSSEISDSLKVSKQNAKTVDLYKSSFIYKSMLYFVDVSIFSNTTNQYISLRHVFLYPDNIITTNSNTIIIVASIAVGTVLTYVIFLVFYKKKQRLPFTAGDKNEEKVNIEMAG